jgi:hypothetical protein
MIDPKKATLVQVRDSVIFLHQVLDDSKGQPKRRIAVVIRPVAIAEATANPAIAEPPQEPSKTKVLVIFATTKKHQNVECIEVPCPSRDASALKLSQSSYFYARNVRFVEAAKLTKIGRTPPELFVNLARLAEDGLVLLAPHG